MSLAPWQAGGGQGGRLSPPLLRSEKTSQSTDPSGTETSRLLPAILFINLLSLFVFKEKNVSANIPVKVTASKPGRQRKPESEKLVQREKARERALGVGKKKGHVQRRETEEEIQK